MRLKESQILDEGIRAKIIKEILDGGESFRRKSHFLKKHEIYRDKNKKWVIESLQKEGLRSETIAQMSNRASNISIARRIVNKLARNYVTPPGRSVQSGEDAIEAWTDELDFNTKMKKADRYRELFRNTLVQVVPTKDTRESLLTNKDKYRLNVKILPPWSYDVIEDENDRTRPGVVILSEFPEGSTFADSTPQSAGSEGRRTPIIRDGSSISDGIDQLIADSPSDYQSELKYRKFIWWSDNYHFTTDFKGKVLADLSPDDRENPIGLLPFINMSGDQDGQFWAQGGDDISEGSILINKKITDLNYIAYLQGWGQLVISGRNLPKNIEGGPGKAMKFNLEIDDPTPQVDYVSSNPPLGDWLETIKSLLALLLSTNGLSVRNISASLDSTDFPSGVAMLIEQSDVVEFNRDVQMQFQDAEPMIWELIQRWVAAYKATGELVESQESLPEITDANVKVKFNDLRPPISAKETLEEYKLRKDLGLSTMADLIKLDNPDLSIEQVQEKLVEIQEQKKANQEAFIGKAIRKQSSGIEEEPEDSEEEDGEES